MMDGSGLHMMLFFEGGWEFIKHYPEGGIKLPVKQSQNAPKKIKQYFYLALSMPEYCKAAIISHSCWTFLGFVSTHTPFGAAHLYAAV